MDKALADHLQWENDEMRRGNFDTSQRRNEAVTCNCPRSSYGVKHTEKCYDETIGKMLGYHVEDEKRIKQLEQMLRNAREKLLLYRKAHSGEYLGGVEFTTLIRSIDAALDDSQSDTATKPK